MNNSFDFRNGCTLEQLVSYNIPKSRYDPLHHQKYPLFSFRARPTSKKSVNHVSQTPSPPKTVFKSTKQLPEDHVLQTRFKPYTKAEITNKHSKKAFTPIPHYDLAEEMHKEFTNDDYSLGKLVNSRIFSCKVSRLPIAALTNRQIEKITLIKEYNNLEFKDTKGLNKSKSPTKLVFKRNMHNLSNKGIESWKKFLNPSNVSKYDKLNDKSLPNIAKKLDDFETELKRKQTAVAQISEEIRRDLQLVSSLQNSTPRYRDSSRSNTIRSEYRKKNSGKNLSPDEKPIEISVYEDSESTIRYSDDFKQIYSPNYQNLPYKLYDHLFK